MTPKPRWDRVGSPSALAHYVPRGLDRFLPAHLARDLPTATGSQLGRAKAVFSVLARAGITYGHEPSSSAPGRQVIREPSEVLAGPRHGTCLDLAVLYAGACLDAGLHPAVLVADPTRPTDPAHAIVLVWTGGDWRGRPTREDPFVDLGDGRGVWHSVADAVLDTIRAGSDQPGSVLAVDVSLVAYGSPGRDAQNDTDALWESALARGASLVADGARQKLGIDIGRTYDREDAFTVLAAPPQEPLGPPYTTERPDAEIGPLEAVKARAGIVPFCPRDELDALREWFEAPAKDPTDLVRAAVVHGVGGSGKTRLAAQLSEQLNREGWYAGFARRIPSIGGLEYLTRLACPVLVIIDYPEGIPEESLATLLSAIAGRRDPTGLLFTSRADGITAGQWWTRTSAIAEDAGLDLKGIRSLALSERHHAPAQVYQAALAEFSRRANQEPPTLVVPPEPPESATGPPWTW